MYIVGAVFLYTETAFHALSDYCRLCACLCTVKQKCNVHDQNHDLYVAIQYYI